MSDALSLALFALNAAVAVAALAVLLIVVRLIAAIRAYVGVLAALPEITPQVTVNQGGTVGNPDGTHAHGPYPWPREWQEWFEQAQRAPKDEDGQTDVRLPPPWRGDQDDFGRMPPFGPPAAGSKTRQDLADEST
jgi:hypothetical protein